MGNKAKNIAAGIAQGVVESTPVVKDVDNIGKNIKKTTDYIKKYNHDKAMYLMNLGPKP